MLIESSYRELHLADPVKYLEPHLPGEIDFSGLPLLWRDDSAVKTFFDVSFSLSIPYLEDLITNTVLEAKPLIKDPYLVQQIDMLCEQEDNHRINHYLFNQALIKQHQLPLKKYLPELMEMIAKYQKMPLNARLEVISLIEAMTSIVAGMFFREIIHEKMDPRAKKLIQWHCVEEWQHRCVAFNVYKEVTKAKRPNFARTFAFSSSLMFIMLKMTFCFLNKTHHLYRWKTLKDFLWMLAPPKGAIFNFTMGYFRFLREDFNPETLYSDDKMKIIVDTIEKTFHEDEGKTIN